MFIFIRRISNYLRQHEAEAARRCFGVVELRVSLNSHNRAVVTNTEPNCAWYLCRIGVFVTRAPVHLLSWWAKSCEYGNDEVGAGKRPKLHHPLRVWSLLHYHTDARQLGKYLRSRTNKRAEAYTRSRQTRVKTLPVSRVERLSPFLRVGSFTLDAPLLSIPSTNKHCLVQQDVLWSTVSVTINERT